MASKNGPTLPDRRSYRGKAALESKHPPKLVTLSPAVLFSCYAASAAIVVLCGMEARSQFLLGDGQTGGLYILLGALGVLASVFITYRQVSAKKQTARQRGQRGAARKK